MYTPTQVVRMTEHTNEQFDADLESVRSQCLQRGGVVEAMSQESVDAVPTGDLYLVEKVREREKQVNRHEVDIDERISLILARHQPTAIDLRPLPAVSNMLTDMARRCDAAEKIPPPVRRLYDPPQSHTPAYHHPHIATKH